MYGDIPKYTGRFRSFELYVGFGLVAYYDDDDTVIFLGRTDDIVDETTSNKGGE